MKGVIQGKAEVTTQKSYMLRILNSNEKPKSADMPFEYGWMGG